MLLAMRAMAKRAGDFEKADELRELLREMSVDVFDNERVWRVRAGPASMCMAGDDDDSCVKTRRSILFASCYLCAQQTASVALAAIPADMSGTWAITETRGGQKCTATLMLQPTRAPQSVEETRRGAARYQGVCVDSADGSWVVQEGAGPESAPRLAWRLEYEKSTVYFALDIKEAEGVLKGRGDVYAAPRADPKSLARVGSFDAKRVTKDWDLRDARVAKLVTNKML